MAQRLDHLRDWIVFARETGVTLDVQGPPAHQVRSDDEPVRLHANATMMCGCPIEPGGLWNADGFQVRALVSRNGEPEDEVDLAYAGATSQFAASLEGLEPGAWAATVYAYDPLNGNTGVDHTTWFVR